MKAAGIFADGMVLQRNQPIAIWGDGAPGESVRARLGDGVEALGVADDAGRWKIMLPPSLADRGLTLTIEAPSEVLRFEDVCVGEVWVAGGQSNMEFQLEFDAEFDAVLLNPDLSEVRFFDVAPLSYVGQEAEHDYSKFEVWRRAQPDDLRYFSAVAYYFASRVAAELRVPIGIIGCNWGGTPACAWADRERLAEGAARVWIDDFERGLSAFDSDEDSAAFRKHHMSDRSDPFGDELINRVMRESLDDVELLALQPSFVKNVLHTIGTLHPNRPGGLFETMVRRIAPYSLRGFLWYQGESDVPHAGEHQAALEAVVRSWRSLWNSDEMPFLIAQLAPFGANVFGSGELFPVIRSAQQRVARELPAVWIASTGDAGHPYDIHPKHKRPVGERLALLALLHVYERSVGSDAPTLRRATRTGSEVRLDLDYADGLQWNGAEQPFDVINGVGDPVASQDLVLDGESIVLRGIEPGPIRIRFATRGYYEVGITNGEGVPLLPFDVLID